MSKKEKRFSKSGLLIVFSMVVALIILLAVALPNGFGSSFGGGGKDLNDDDSPGLSDVMNKGTPIMIFDKSSETKALFEAFEKDGIESVYYVDANDEGNASDKEDDVTEAYRAFKNIIVGEEVQEPEDGMIYTVNFTLADGTECTYVFKVDDGGDSEAVKLDGKWYGGAGFSDLLKVLKDM